MSYPINDPTQLMTSEEIDAEMFGYTECDGCGHMFCICHRYEPDNETDLGVSR